MSILNPINDLVAWVIMHIYSVLSPVFGATSSVTWVLSIAALVVIMRVILLPLFIKQMHTQRAMTALTPKITELRKKYKGDKERLNQETMKLYQEAGVNPLMGCLPVLLQMPLFFALFSVLRNIAEYDPPKIEPLYHLTKVFVVNVGKAEIFGTKIKDTFLHGTSLHVHVVVAIVVLVSMGTTYLTVRQSMKRGMMPTGSDSPMGQSQKMMAYVMPLFALTGLYWPFGLVLYWVMTNLWTLGQQYVLLRKYPVGAAAAAIGGNAPIAGRGRPATALGLTSGQGRAKPTAGSSGPGGKRAGSASAGQADSPVSEAVDASPAGVADANGARQGKAGSGSRKVAEGPRTTSAGAAQNGGRTARDSAAVGRGAKAAGAVGSSNGHDPAEAGGMLRRFGRNRPDPEPPAPAEPEIKIVRNQRQRQSRSKRSGKR